MSYSFTVTADTKAEVMQKIAEAFDTVVNSQPSHAADREAAVHAGWAFVEVLADPPEGQEIHVSMYGSLSWDHQSPEAFISANVAVNAGLRAKA